MTKRTKRTAPSRRDFFKTSAVAALAGTIAPYAAAAPRFKPGGAEMLKVGLVGCGGRGTGAAADALRADPNVKLVALADTFRDRLDSTLKTLQNTENVAPKVDVDEEHKFVGWDAYKGVIETCDVVLLATSPHFRPLHMRAAVEAGRHLFVEKPVAVDGPGLRSILETTELAKKKGLSIVSGLCYRYQFAKQETIRRIHDGAIGEIAAMQCTYNTGELWYREPKPDWTPMEVQMRNWLYFSWLSGDHIAEQHIHSLDKLAWAMGSYPVRCTASGGRIIRTDSKYGNVYDHFNTCYEWENGVKGFSSCRQMNGTKHNVSDHCFGTRGTAHIQTHSIEAEGGWKWRHRREGKDNMYQNEHDALFEAIRAGEPINNGEYMAHSTLMAMMGRMSAYTGQTIGFEQALNSQEDLTPPAYEWGPMEVAPVARPGVTQFS
ncbi:MAG: Gfo/Idh/MocA family oxidoreductase [Planctomycetota bacterium]|nr:Gfo/Idh/MocA family oxidoreductase [Planctomycetota bacterium]